MTTTNTTGNVKGSIMLDPMEQYNATAQQIMDSLGALPSFMNVENPDSLDKQLDDSYHGRCNWKEAKHIDKDGVSRYPGDPAMSPAATLQRGDEQVFIYPHAFVAYRPNEETQWVWCRME